MFVGIPVRPNTKELVDAFVPMFNWPEPSIQDTFLIEKLDIFKLLVAVPTNVDVPDNDDHDGALVPLLVRTNPAVPEFPPTCNIPLMFVAIPVRPNTKEVVDTVVPMFNWPEPSIQDTFLIEKLDMSKLLNATDASNVFQVGVFDGPLLVKYCPA
jgi:hypothetical protein